MYRRNRISSTGVTFLFAILAACAGTPSSDPWEPANRGIYAVNDGLDRVTLKPVAKVYRKLLPAPMRRGVGNFFSNLRAPLTIVNQVLQGKGRVALSDTGRFLLNSTAGIGGLFDPASKIGLEEHREDFGQTLAVWGVPDGPFVMVPLLGPRNLRDALATPLDLVAHPLVHYENTSVRDKLWALEAVNVRARLLSGETLIADSTDPYITIREAYQQNRRYHIYDGNPPDDDYASFDEFLDQDTASAKDPGDQHE